MLPVDRRAVADTGGELPVLHKPDRLQADTKPDQTLMEGDVYCAIKES